MKGHCPTRRRKLRAKTCFAIARIQNDDLASQTFSGLACLPFWLRSGERFQVKLHVIRKQNKYTFEKKNNLIICCFQDCWMKVSAGRLATVLNRMGTGSRDQIKLEVRRGRRDQSEIHRSGEQTLVIKTD